MMDEIKAMLKELGFENIKFKIDENVYVKNIDELDLSVRANNVLHRTGFECVGDIIDNIPKLKNAKGSGVKVVRETLNAILELQFSQMSDEELTDYFTKLLLTA